MAKVDKEIFEDAVYNLEVTGTETYRNGDQKRFYSIGRGKHHKLLACHFHREVGDDEYNLYDPLL